MSVYNLGRILPIFKGNYVSGTTYNKLDLVYVNNHGSYVAKKSTSEYPINSEDWVLVVKDGAKATGAITAEQAKEIIESYDYTTLAEVQEQGYLTEVPDEYITDEELAAKGFLTEIPSEYITEEELNEKNYVTMSDLESKGYITEVPPEYITENELDAKNYTTMAAVEDKGYLTEHQDISGKQDVLVSGESIKTINGEDILGEGNIEIKVDDGVKTYIIDPNASSISNWTEIVNDYKSSDLGTVRFVIKGEFYGYYYEPSLVCIDNTSTSYFEWTSWSSAINTYGTFFRLEYNVKGVRSKKTSNPVYKISSGGSYITSTMKTINGSTLAGSGDITIESGITEDEAKTLIEGYDYVTNTALSGKDYATNASLNTKQNTLVSGTNIKSINNESLLGSGNIVLPKIMKLTQAEYDALETKDDTTIYIITDAK